MFWTYVTLIIVAACVSFIVSRIATHLYIESFLEVSRVLDKAYVDQMVEETLKLISDNRR